jgi:metal-responsive CopG/Arc/MetJ family transcriptional regulator
VSGVAKIAISLDQDLLLRAEKLCKRTGETRSALVTRALANLLAEEDLQEKIARYVRGYRNVPEPETPPWDSDE